MGAEQKVAIITGASRGIGEALARAYRDRNFRVVATSRSIKPSSDLNGFFNITRRVAKEMLKQGTGHIVQITTSLVDHANSSVPSVLTSLTKGGLNAATKSLAIEFASRGVRVNAV